jgi:hypothetical protein
MTKVKEWKKEWEAAAKVLRETGRKAFEEDVREFLKNNPKVKALSIKAGTPGFNDGDPCLFSNYGLEVALNEVVINDDTASYELDDLFKGRYDLDDRNLKEELDKLESPLGYSPDYLPFLLEEGRTIFTKDAKYLVEWWDEY